VAPTYGWPYRVEFLLSGWCGAHNSCTLTYVKMSVIAVAAAAVLLPAVTDAAASPTQCSSSRCLITTRESGVVAYEYFTGLRHVERLSEVDVISLSQRCHVVRLHYRYVARGRSHLLPSVSVPVHHAASTSGGPWHVGTSTWLTATIRTHLRASGAPRTSRFSLPQPTSRWSVYVGHDKSETLAPSGVLCLL
jgi:hypothetical protein